jgi:hypothetical protein
MITKRKEIELIQNRLAGTGTVEDLSKRYPYKVISEMIGKAYSDVFATDPASMQDMAIEYDLVLSTNNGNYSTLPVRPIGSSGLLWVEGNSQMIPVDQGGMEGKILGVVEPGRIPGCKLVNGTKIVYDIKPDEPLKVLMVPNYSDLDDDDNVVMMGVDTKVYQIAIQLIKMTDQAPEEFYNDGRDDARRVQMKNEFLNRRE